jgi:hypothetical protein
MQKALSAGASDIAMRDIVKIGGMTGWHRAQGSRGSIVDHECQFREILDYCPA